MEADEWPGMDSIGSDRIGSDRIGSDRLSSRSDGMGMGRFGFDGLKEEVVGSEERESGLVCDDPVIVVLCCLLCILHCSWFVFLEAQSVVGGFCSRCNFTMLCCFIFLVLI